MTENGRIVIGDLVEQRVDRIVGKKDPQIPYVGLEHLAQGEPTLLGLSQADVSISTNTVFRANDILFGKLRPNLRKSLQVGFDGCCSTDILVFNVRPGAAKGFVARLFQSDRVFAEAIRTAEGTKMPRTSWARLKELPIFCPPIGEQRRIAEILDTVDAAIRQTEALIAKLKQMKAGLLHDLLTRGLDEHGELRDPVAHPEQFKDSPLGRVPREWEIAQLGGLSEDRIANGFFKRPELVGAGYRLVNVLDLYQPFGVNLMAVERVNASAKEQLKFCVRPGDCFFTRSSLNLAGIAHCNIVRELPEAALFECHLMRVRPDQIRLIPEFLAHWCRTDWARRFFMARAKQVTMTTISQPDIVPLPVPLPSKMEQALIVQMVDAQDVRISSEQNYRDKLKQLKKGLMDDLLTGRVRVKLHEEEEEC